MKQVKFFQSGSNVIVTERHIVPDGAQRSVPLTSPCQDWQGNYNGDTVGDALKAGKLRVVRSGMLRGTLYSE